MKLASSPLLSLAAGTFAFTMSLVSQSAAVMATDARHVAEIEQVQGAVLIERRGIRSDHVGAGFRIERRDKLITGPDSRIAVNFRDGSRLVLGGNGAISIEDWRPEAGRSPGVLILVHETGAIRLFAARSQRAPDRRFELRMPSALVTMKGGELWSGPLGDAIAIVALSGTVDVRNDAGLVVLEGRAPATFVRTRAAAPERPRRLAGDELYQARSAVEIGLK